MTRGPRASETADDGDAHAGCNGPEVNAGPRRKGRLAGLKRQLGRGAGGYDSDWAKREKEEGVKRKGFFLFSNAFKQRIQTRV
jgi:hypothetical protein